MNTKSTTAQPTLFAATVLLGAVVLTAFAVGSSGSANAQGAMLSAAPVVGAVSLHDGVDWSRVAIVPASPAQSVAAYDR